MSDPERKPAPDVDVSPTRGDMRKALIDKWSAAYPDRVFCFQDANDPKLASKMKIKRMTKVTAAEAKQLDVPRECWRGDLVCWQPREVYVAERTQMHEQADGVADLFRDPLGDPDDTRLKARPKKPKPLKRRKPGEALNND
jgi:hypothetical protein